jgi:hypothetical protein
LVVAMIVVQTGCAASRPAMAPEAKVAASDSVAPAAPAQAGSPAPAPPPPAPVPFSSPAPAPAPGVPSTPQASTPATPTKSVDTKSAKSAGPTTRAPVIIYQGSLGMTADEEGIPKTIDKIIDVAESVGGHIAGRKDQSVQIKVPSANFRDAMTKIESIGGVVSRSVTADDVSEEFHDLEVRLGNLRSTRTRLQEFLAKANGINDMLTVERELERVALEIDRIEGRLEFLRTRASMSVISVALTAKPKPVAPIVVATPPTPPLRAGVDLPIPWVGEIGIDPLLSLRK